MLKAMIITVGGTPQPVIKSIEEHKPEFISFLASQDSFDQISSIKKTIFDKGFNFKSEITLLDDINDLLHCYYKAEEAVERVRTKGYEKESVIVDYTGGTKNMSVALSLAVITHCYSFSYVGGKERSKNGLGIVINGQEKIFTSINPWDFLAVEEKKKIAILFNRNQFNAAKDLTDEILQKTTQYKSVFKKIGFLIEGFYKWDLFRHQDAMDSFKRAKVEEIMDIDDKHFKIFAKDTAAKLDFLEKIVKIGKKPNILYILDLYANAERRFEEGKIDDAILRLYRLVEMIAQEQLLNEYNIDASDVKTDLIPESLREDFIKNYKSSRDGRIKIPQTAAFKLLEAFGGNVGKVYKSNEPRFLDIQSARNYSYLAHGFEYSKERTYSDLKDFILKLGIFKEDEAPVFPEMGI